MTHYLVRHAQSLPKKAQPFSEWSLSVTGTRQAEELAGLLGPLRIAQVFSSPFVRSLHTAMPFARKAGLKVEVVDDLREHHLTNLGGPPSDEVWRKSWEDFGFCLEGCETSFAAQARISRTIQDIAGSATGTSAIFTHGMVIGLFLNSLTRSLGRKEAEALTNPDVLKVEWGDGVVTWDREFRLPGLKGFATTHAQTPREEDGPQGGAEIEN